MKLTLAFFLLTLSLTSVAQDNSPYSRYGLGDISPSTNILNRGMGSVSAAYSDNFKFSFIDNHSINFSNPASYSGFLAFLENDKSKKLASGRVILDVGLNFDTRTLMEPNTPNRFRSANAIFSYVQLGLPLRRNWGLSFGIRPVSRIAYSVNSLSLLKDPVSGDTIENAITQFNGNGGSYLPTIGTGFGFTLANRETPSVHNKTTLSLGANIGYLFGNRELSTLRSLYNDSISYYSSEHSTNSNYGNVFVGTGMQLQFEMEDKVAKTANVLRFGLSGSWKQTLKGNVDSLRRTFSRSSTGEILQIDSVYRKSFTPGDVIYPGQYKAGIAMQHVNTSNLSGWLLGVEYEAAKWSQFRYFGQQDSVQDSYMFHVGGQYNPRPRENYFSHVFYRFGVTAGKDYIKVGNDLPVLGFTFGLGLPFVNYNRMSQAQQTRLNLSFEYVKRGNNTNLMKENLFRISAGFNFSDTWFTKRKYD